MTSWSRPGSPAPSAATAPSSTRHSTAESPVRTFTARKGARHADRCRAGCQPAGTAAAAIGAGPAGRPLSCRGRYGRLVPGPLPGPVIRAAAAHADHRRAAAYERAGDQPGVGHGQRRLRGRHGAGRPVRPAPAPAADAAGLRAAAGDRVGAGGRGGRPGDVHRWARAAGAVHQPAADRGRAAAVPWLPGRQAGWSAMIMNMCLFGAVTADPLIGGAQASFHAWRPLCWIVAGIAAAGLAMSLLTF